MKGSKYGNDSMFESCADNYIFIPISNILIPLLYRLGLTPNKVTLLSTISTILSAYFLYKNNGPSTFIYFYFTGYLLDCIDGRFARRYNMSSKLGMISDGVSDVVTNIIVLIAFILKFRNNSHLFFMLPLALFLTYQLGVAYGLTEAIDCFNNNNHDNFYQHKKELLKGFGNNYFDKLLSKTYIHINKLSYISYKNKYPTFDKNKIENMLKNTKEFGPGNYCIFGILIVLFLCNY
tara:strand:- start:4284 stop:4988 length:705 start_codon:yes stop_codon:yes gene_type:complete